MDKFLDLKIYTHKIKNSSISKAKNKYDNVGNV